MSSSSARTRPDVPAHRGGDLRRSKRARCPAGGTETYRARKGVPPSRLRRTQPISPSTLPLSLPLPGRPTEVRVSRPRESEDLPGLIYHIKRCGRVQISVLGIELGKNTCKVAGRDAEGRLSN
jgi:hypothetical protein